MSQLLNEDSKLIGKWSIDNSYLGFPEHLEAGNAVRRQAMNLHIVLSKINISRDKLINSLIPVAKKGIQNHEVYFVFLPLLGKPNNRLPEA